MSATFRGRKLRRSLGAAGLSGLVAAGLFLSIGTAEAATLFGADFESGSTTGWSKSGGTWSVVSDGTSVLAQSDTGSERARQFAGTTSWTDYSVQARVKATAFGSSAGVVALTGRAAGSTKMYRLSLTRYGFKLGGEDIAVNHIVRRTIAYRNGKHGFTYNSNPGSLAISNNLSIDNTERNFNFDAGTSVFRTNTSCRYSSGTNDRIIGNSDATNQFWSGTNGSRCSSYSGALSWSFAADGRLAVTIGGVAVSL